MGIEWRRWSGEMCRMHTSLHTHNQKSNEVSRVASADEAPLNPRYQPCRRYELLSSKYWDFLGQQREQILNGKAIHDGFVINVYGMNASMIRDSLSNILSNFIERCGASLIDSCNNKHPK